MAIMVSASTFANSEIYPPVDKKSNSFEIGRLLKSNNVELKKELFGKVVFSLAEDGKIVIHSVLTKDQYVRDYVAGKLKDQKLSGDQWEVGKTYILPVRMKLK